jgi:hypothetical protein
MSALESQSARFQAMVDLPGNQCYSEPSDHAEYRPEAEVRVIR